MNSEIIAPETLGQLYDAAEILFQKVENTTLESNSNEFQVNTIIYL